VSRQVRVAICFGQIGGVIGSLWSGYTTTVVVETLPEAVNAAFENAVPGETVLFSPGTSSFDQYPGYEARGDAFKREVMSRTSLSPTTTPANLT
ncbi:MAG: hypothetical protein AAF236_06700, partial [Verrucomicrobiota bacterium]